MFEEFRFALRILRKTPSLLIAAIFTLAIGIGANTAIFRVVNAILIQPLPYHAPEELISIHELNPTNNEETKWLTREEYEAWQKGSRTLQEIAALNPVGFNIRIGNGTQRVQGARVSANFFSLLGVKALHGRVFQSRDESSNQGMAAILDHAFWQDNFAADSAVIGKEIQIDHQAFTIVGVLPASFDYHYHQDVWIPLRFTGEELQTPNDQTLHLLARRKSNVTNGQVQAELTTIAQQVHKSAGASRQDVRPVPLQELVAGDVRPALLFLQAAVGFVLLIVCVNMTNLLLAHSATRQREIAVRLALGASRLQIMQHFFIESAILALLGGALGVAITTWTHSYLLARVAPYLPFMALQTKSFASFGFAFVLSVITGMLVGLVPAVRFSKQNLIDALKSGDRSSTAGHTKWRSFLVTSEVALGVILMIGAGLMIKSFSRLQSVPPGFVPDKILKLRIALPAIDYPDDAKRKAYYHEAIARLKSLPGAESVAMIQWLPFSGIGLRTPIQIPDRPSNEKTKADCHVITPEYFRVMQIPVKLGRAFDLHDDSTGSSVLIVSENFSRRYYGATNPIGKKIEAEHNGAIFKGEIVGVVGDLHNQTLEAPVQPAFYVSYLQSPWDSVALRELVVRTNSDPDSIAESARAKLWSIDPNVPVYQVQSMTRVLDRSLGSRRMNTNLITIFASIALVLVIIGVYGLITYSVNQRTREIGVRMAMGAQRSDILRLIIRQAMNITFAGIFAGLAAALALTNAMVKLLFGVSSSDPATFAGISLLIVIVALLASYFPALRATKVSPMTALRND